MPCFYFDLVIGRECREQGGMILESQDAAAEKTTASQASWRLYVPS